MKLTFVDVRYKAPVTLPEDFIDQLPKKVVLFLNIQFHHQYQQLKQQLENSGKEVITVRPKHAWHEGQILGCSVEDWDAGQEAFVYIGDGLFHPKALVFKNDEKVFIFDPKTGKTRILTKQDVDQILRAQKGAIATFYSSKNIGVLVTTKYGQTRMKPALKLQAQFPDKTFYFLLADVIDFSKLEDFSFIECFINTACPRVMDDNQKVPKPMLNLEDLGTVW
jgi:2-(3-amino-3-carboxypropyl)histidine synthase